MAPTEGYPFFLRKVFQASQVLSDLLESTQVSGGKPSKSRKKSSSFENPPVSENLKFQNLKFQNLKSPNFIAQSSRLKAQDSKTSGTKNLRSRKTSDFAKLQGPETSRLKAES